MGLRYFFQGSITEKNIKSHATRKQYSKWVSFLNKMNIYLHEIDKGKYKACETNEPKW